MPIHTLKRSSRIAIIFRALGYASLAGAGVSLAITFPLFTRDGVYVILSWWLIVGGLISLLGTVADRWAGEFIGLPLLFTAMYAFCLMIFKDTYRMGGWDSVGQSLGNILLLAGFASLFVARWRDVSAVYRSVAKGAKIRARHR